MKNSISEEIIRIKGLMKSLTENEYNTYGLTKTDQGFRYDNYDDNDFSDDLIIHPEPKVTDPISSKKIPETPKILDYNNINDREEILNKIINHKIAKNVTPETREIINGVYKDTNLSNFVNGFGLFGDRFKYDILYKLLLNGIFEEKEGRLWSITEVPFLKKLIKKIDGNKFKFKNNFNPSMEKFNNYMVKNNEKFEDEFYNYMKKIFRKN